MTNAELAILSLIAEKPRHGYEIEQVIEQREMRNWTEVGFSSIYYLLKKLEKEGFLLGKIEPSCGQGPARKVFRFTPAGHDAYRQATFAALSTPTPPYSAFLLGLSNLKSIPTEEAIQALQQYQRKITLRAEHLRARWTTQEVRLPYNIHALFDLSMTLINAELNWITGFIHQLEERKERGNAQN